MTLSSSPERIRFACFLSPEKLASLLVCGCSIRLRIFLGDRYRFRDGLVTAPEASCFARAARRTAWYIGLEE